MNQLLSHDLWPIISKLAKNASKRAAIAYVSSDEHIQFADGDLLVCDASHNAIKSGQTNATVLKRASDNGAILYSLPGLHAKIILLNEKAFIGSANASGASASSLVEAGILTDQPSIVVMAQAFVNQLASQATPLTTRRLENLLAIKVDKRWMGSAASRPRVKTKVGGHRTWIVGISEILKELPEDQSVVEATAEKCREKLSNPGSNIEWVRFAGSSRLRKECVEHDWLIQMWSHGRRKTPSDVYERMPVVGKEDFGTATYFYIEQFPGAESRAKSWGDFKRLASRAGVKRQIKPGSQFEIKESQADALQAVWAEK